MVDHQIIEAVEEYAARAGLEPTTVCLKAVGNGRLLERTRRRIAILQADAERLRKYMKENPVSVDARASHLSDKHANAGAAVQGQDIHTGGGE